MRYCCEDISKIENYDLAKVDNFKGWNIHHRLETHTSDGERRLVDISLKELEALGVYYDRPANELIFLTTSEHNKLHSRAKKGKHRSEEARRRMSKVHKGKLSPNKEKLMSEEQRKRISETLKGRRQSEATKLKRSETISQLKWYNNGAQNIRSKECPEGFTPGRLKFNK